MIIFDKKAGRNVFLALAFVFLAVRLGPALAGVKETGVLAGFGKGHLRQKGHYIFFPLMFRIGFDLAPGRKELSEFQVEPFVSVVSAPDSNVEAGANLLFKFAYPLTKRLYNYYEGGAGVIYITQHAQEQSTQFNFIPQAGAGLSYFLKDGIAVNAGYRYRHLSNSSIKRPNKGIDSGMVIVGVSFFR